MGMFTPEMVTPPRSTVMTAESSVVRSFLLMRTVIGILGICLPLVLVIGDLVLLDDSLSVRGSLSAYYHSGMRDVFVGVLVVIGVFLITYKVFRRSLDNTLSIVAGAAAITTALFPTGIPDEVSSLPTPLQDRLGEGVVSTIHTVAAAVFVVALAVLSIFFGIREGGRDRDRDQSRSPTFWKRFHFAAAGIIVVTILVIAATSITGIFDTHALFVGEAIIALAFGASWLMKGLELDALLGRGLPADTPASA